MLLGLATVFALMLLKEAGVPIPIPSDVIMLGAAARAATGEWSLPLVIVVVEAAMLIGGTAQYLLVRGAGRRIVYRFGRYLGLTPPRLERAAAALQRGGLGAIALGMTTPGLRAVTIAASGLANLRFGLFFPALLVGDSVFFLLHVAIGYAGGRGLHAISHGGLHTGLLLLGILFVVAVTGLVGWILLRRRAARSRQPDGETEAAVGAWAEAGCPVCLALGALQERRAPATLPA